MRYMSISSKSLLVLIFLFSLFLLSSYFLFVKLKPLLLQTTYPPPIWATIHGNITLTKDYLSSGYNIPTTIFLYIPYNSKYLCQSQILNYIANLDWTNNYTDRSAGSVSTQYSVSFQLPIPMEIYVTPDCNGCDNQLVNISSGGLNKEVNILWSNKRCQENPYTIGNNQTDIANNAISYLDTLRADINSASSGLSQNQRDNVTIGELGPGYSDISNIHYATSGNESLLDSYYALWHSWRGFLLENKLQLINCVNQTQLMLNSHNDTLCYSLESSLNQTFNLDTQAAGINYYQEDNEHNYNSDTIKSNINQTYSLHNYLQNFVYQCEYNSGLISQSLDFQSKTCDSKEVAITFFQYFPPLIYSIIILGIGLLIGQWLNGNRKSR